MKLVFPKESALLCVLQVYVSSVLIRRYGGYGFALLQSLMQELGVVTPGLVYQKIQTLSLNKSLQKHFDSLNSFLRNFGSQLSLQCPFWFRFVLSY